MIKNYFLWALCPLLLALMSCEKEKLSGNDGLTSLESRSNDCRLCNNLISINLIENEQGDCCSHSLNVSSHIEGCRHRVEVNGDIIGYVINSEQSFEIETCLGEVNQIKILGYDQVTDTWISICFQETITCSSCCGALPYILTEEGFSNRDGCCHYTMIPNPEYSFDSCEFRLLLDGVFLPLNQSSEEREIVICGADLILQYFIVNDLCNEEILSCTCSGLEYEVVNLGSTLDSECCNYQVNLSNGTNCDLQLYDENGQSIGTVGVGLGNIFDLQVCPENGLFRMIRIGCSPDDICEEIILPLTCFEDLRFCDDESQYLPFGQVTSTAIGNKCCVSIPLWSLFNNAMFVATTSNYNFNIGQYPDLPVSNQYTGQVGFNTVEFCFDNIGTHFGLEIINIDGEVLACQSFENPCN